MKTFKTLALAGVALASAMGVTVALNAEADPVAQVEQAPLGLAAPVTHAPIRLPEVAAAYRDLDLERMADAVERIERRGERRDERERVLALVEREHVVERRAAYVRRVVGTD